MNNQEIQKQVLLNSDYYQITKLTKTSKAFHDICFGEPSKSFWKEKIQKDFPECSNPILLNLGSKKAYEFLYLQSLDEDFEYEEDAEGPVFTKLEDTTNSTVEYKDTIIAHVNDWFIDELIVESKVSLDINGNLFVQEIYVFMEDGGPILEHAGEKQQIPLPEGVGPVIEIMEDADNKSGIFFFIDVNRRFYNIFTYDNNSMELQVWTYGEISAVSKLASFEYFQGKGKVYPTFEDFKSTNPNYKVLEKDICGNSLLQYSQNSEKHKIWVSFKGESYENPVDSGVEIYKIM